jgi:putative ABC transport system ATP-binding protein
MTAQACILATGLTKKYGDGAAAKTVIDSQDFTLRAGEITLLMGPSGSGKSTLLAMVSGLLKPDHGSVMALGEDLWSQTESSREKLRLASVGFVFQGFNLFPALSARENVQTVLETMGYAPREAIERSIAALEQVGLGDRVDLLPRNLSGGEKQRVAIARALAKEPQLLFADEPTSALDRANGERIANLLKTAAHTTGAAVLCVTHDPRLKDHADRHLWIEDGRISTDNDAARREGGSHAS